MKKVLFLFVCMLGFVACEQKLGNGQSAIDVVKDSLDAVVAQRDRELDEMFSILNEIEEGFRDINEAQNRVNVAKQQGEGESRQERIRENIQFIQSTMKQNTELITALRKQLKESNYKGEQLQKTIDNLTKELVDKNQQLAKLVEELDAKDIHITELDEQIANLNTDISTLTEESKSKSDIISKQDEQLNTAYFVFGTKDELKDQNILVDGKVLRTGFNRNYFTKIDIREKTEIKLYSKSATILTDHPSNSYTLLRDDNKQYFLRISNPQQFWSISKYLVIQVK